MLWIFLAFLTSLVAAAGVELNRHLKQSGLSLNFVKQALMLLCATPFAFFLPRPENVLSFWLAAGVVSLSIVYAQTAMYVLAAQQRSRMASLLGPVQIVMAFLLWCAVSAAFRTELLQDKAQLIFSITGLLMMLYVIVRLYTRHISQRHAILLLLPAALLSAFGDTVSKLVLIDLPPLYLVPQYIFACGVWAVALLAAAIFYRDRSFKKICQPALFKAGSLAALLGIVQAALYLGALMVVPNPAYLTACMMFVPLWVLIWHRLCHTADDLPSRSTFIAITAALLMLLPHLSRLFE